MVLKRACQSPHAASRGAAPELTALRDVYQGRNAEAEELVGVGCAISLQHWVLAGAGAVLEMLILA